MKNTLISLHKYLWKYIVQLACISIHIYIFLEPMVMIALILHLNSFFFYLFFLVLIKTWVRNSQRETLQNNISSYFYIYILSCIC
jgi:hypothetical protein